MVQVRKVRMCVAQGLVPVPMGVRLDHRLFMPVLVMLVMDMTVFVLNEDVFVIMPVPLGQVHPKPEAHQQTCNDQRDGYRLREENQRQHHPDKGCKREVSARASRTEGTEDRA